MSRRRSHLPQLMWLRPNLLCAMDIWSWLLIWLESVRPTPRKTSSALFQNRTAIEGHSNFQLARFGSRRSSLPRCAGAAQDDRDDNEALQAGARRRMFGERGDVDEAAGEEAVAPPSRITRRICCGLPLRNFHGDDSQKDWRSPFTWKQPAHASPQVEDPRARSAFSYAAAYALAQKGLYRRKPNGWVERFWRKFATTTSSLRDHALWTSALIRLGLRRFGEAERLLQALEDAAAARSDISHSLNARILRARLLLQTGKSEEAVALTSEESPTEVYPSWKGEYLATRAMALATTGQSQQAGANRALRR